MSKKEIELTLDEVRELDDFEGVEMVVGEVRAGVVEAEGMRGESWGLVRTVRDIDGVPSAVVWTDSELAHIDARFVRTVEDPPHGVVETDPEKARPVKLGNGRIAFRLMANWAGVSPWVVTSFNKGYTWLTDAEVQALADEFGFEYLVPESEVDAARKEGRRAWIAEVAHAFDQAGVPLQADRVRGTFPDAFGGESDD